MCCRENTNTGLNTTRQHLQTSSEGHRLLALVSYSENEADDGNPGRGHDLGTVGHEVEQRGHDALCCMVELVAQQQ